VPRNSAKPEDCSDCATRSACLLGELSGDEMLAVRPFVRRRVFQRGDVLAEEGDRSDTVRIVKMGNVFGYRRGLDGKRRPIGIAGRGAVFGLFGYFQQPNQASGVGASAGRLCEVPHSTLRALAAQNPVFLEKLVSANTQACGSIAVWSEAMRVRGIVNQLAYAVVLLAEVQRSPVIELPTHTALAELLGATRETVARGLATLEREGGIRRVERKNCEVYRKTLLVRVQRAGSA
jgi:CRP-like cAMP-binding protein